MARSHLSNHFQAFRVGYAEGPVFSKFRVPAGAGSQEGVGGGSFSSRVSGQVMVDTLHVIVLLQRLHAGHYLFLFGFRQLFQYVGDIL